MVAGTLDARGRAGRARRRGVDGRGAGGAAVAGLRVVRPVPQFRGARRRVPRAGRGLPGLLDGLVPEAYRRTGSRLDVLITGNDIVPQGRSAWSFGSGSATHGRTVRQVARCVDVHQVRSILRRGLQLDEIRARSRATVAIQSSCTSDRRGIRCSMWPCGTGRHIECICARPLPRSKVSTLRSEDRSTIAPRRVPSRMIAVRTSRDMIDFDLGRQCRRDVRSCTVQLDRLRAGPRGAPDQAIADHGASSAPRRCPRSSEPYCATPAAWKHSRIPAAEHRRAAGSSSSCDIDGRAALEGTAADVRPALPGRHAGAGSTISPSATNRASFTDDEHRTAFAAAGLDVRPRCRRPDGARPLYRHHENLTGGFAALVNPPSTITSQD